MRERLENIVKKASTKTSEVYHSVYNHVKKNKRVYARIGLISTGAIGLGIASPYILPGISALGIGTVAGFGGILGNSIYDILKSEWDIVMHNKPGLGARRTLGSWTSLLGSSIGAGATLALGTAPFAFFGVVALGAVLSTKDSTYSKINKGITYLGKSIKKGFTKGMKYMEMPGIVKPKYTN